MLKGLPDLLFYFLTLAEFKRVPDGASSERRTDRKGGKMIFVDKNPSCCILMNAENNPTEVLFNSS